MDIHRMVDDPPLPAVLDTLFGTEGKRKLTLWAYGYHVKDTSPPTLTKATLADRVGVSRKTVVEYIDELAVCGVFQRFGYEHKPRYRPHVNSDTMGALDAFTDAIIAGSRDPTNVPENVRDDVSLPWL